MQEINKFCNKLLYPYYWIERKIVEYIIHNHFKTFDGIFIDDINIEDIYPFYLRQYDDENKSIYWDEYFKPNIQISYKPISESYDLKCIISLEILKYKLRWFNFNFDYLRVY